MTQPNPRVDQSAVDAVRAWRKLSRAARRSVWKQANRLRAPGTPRFDWNTLPPPTPLQSHILSGKAHPNSRGTLAVSLGLNRAQRRAMESKKGPRTLTIRGSRKANCVLEGPTGQFWKNPPRRWERPTSTWPGPWNKFAVRLEFNRRLQTAVEARRRRNVWYRRALMGAASLPRRLGRLIRRAVMWLYARHPFHLVNRLVRSVPNRSKPS